jgi:hypothetical protein
VVVTRQVAQVEDATRDDVGEEERDQPAEEGDGKAVARASARIEN